MTQVIASPDSEERCARVNKRELTRVQHDPLTWTEEALATTVAGLLPKTAAD